MDFLKDLAVRRAALDEREAQFAAGLADREIVREQLVGAAIMAAIRDGDDAASGWIDVARDYAAQVDAGVPDDKRRGWVLEPAYLREDGYRDRKGEGGVVWSRKTN